MEVKANGFGAGYNVYRLTAAQIPLCKTFEKKVGGELWSCRPI